MDLSVRTAELLSRMIAVVAYTAAAEDAFAWFGAAPGFSVSKERTACNRGSEQHHCNSVFL